MPIQAQLEWGENAHHYKCRSSRPKRRDWAKKHVPAILEAWYPGEYGGQDCRNTVLRHDPAGRLTITFPQTVGQLPDYYNSNPWRVYRYIDSNGEPLFPCGFGLSYTTFRYDHLSVQAPQIGSDGDVEVSVDVTNTGRRAGDEVAQLYMHEDVSSWRRRADRWKASNAFT